MECAGQKMIRVMHGIFSCILEERDVLQAWKRSGMTLIHKGGEKEMKEIGNYRPGSITNILAKVFGMKINEKIHNMSGTAWNLGERNRVVLQMVDVV